MANLDFEMTPAERHYAQTGGDTSELVKQGLIQLDEQGEPQNGQQKPDQREPEPQLQAQPEPPQAQDDDDDAPQENGKPRRRMVDKRALDEARAELKEIRAREIAANEKWARLEERFKTFQEALAAPEPEPEPEPEPDLPDPEQDIIGFNKGLAARLDRRFAQFEEALNGVNQRLGGINEQTTAVQRTNEMVNAYRSDAASFAQKQPDFMEAYRFLIQSRNAELQAGGYDNPAERQRLIVADEQALVSRALQGQSSPAERIYALAKARGYQLKQPAQNGTQNAQNSNGAQRQQPSVTEEIARAQAGQNAALSLSNAGGGGRVPSGLSLDEIANMTDDQFRAFARKNPQAFAAFEQMLGKGQ